MYKSPIEIVEDIQEKVSLSMESNVVRAVQTVGINIDKHELIAALMQDKLRYEAAYEQGKRDAEKHGRWIPIKTRPMDEEERAEWSEKLGYDIEYEEAVIYTSQLPDDGQEVLTCSRYGTIRTDKFENDPDYGCSFEENGDMDGIVAWMPLPDPWKGEEE